MLMTKYMLMTKSRNIEQMAYRKGLAYFSRVLFPIYF